MRLFKALLAAALSVLLLSFTAAAQLPVSVDSRIQEILDLVGKDLEIRDMNWMVPGARIVFDSSISSVSNPKESNDSWLICDIFAVTDDGLVGFSISNTLLENGKPIIREGIGSIFGRKEASLLWFNPDILSAIAVLPGNVVANAGKKLIAGSWQSVYTMQALNSSGYVSETSYSSETGILVSDEYVSTDESGKALTHNSLKFKGYRQAFTGLEEQNQAAIKKGTKLTYTVKCELDGAPYEDMPAMSFVISAEEKGADWVLYKMDSYEDGEIVHVDYVAESYRFLDDSCSYYPPEWLRTLKPGTLLSDDDLIESTVTVVGEKDTPHGKVMLIRGIEGLTEATDEYDMDTGFMVRSTTVLHGTGMVIIVELAEVQYEEE